MSRRSSNRQLNAAIENIVIDEGVIVEEVPETTVEDYEKLNAKCDTVISKIKNRKKKSQPQTI
jgi:hypothetical protein